MLDDRLPGIREKRAEIEGWVELARRQDWYRPDDEVDAHLPFLNRDLGWEDKNWGANEFSFSLLLDRYVRPGMRVLELGAAKCWGAQHVVPRGCSYVAVDILDDPVIGLGRGRFYEQRVGPFARVQADGEHLPFRDETFDLAYCVATLHHALDLPAMVREMARVTKRGGLVCGLNEGTRAPRASGDNAEQSRGARARDQRARAHALGLPLGFARAGLRRAPRGAGRGLRRARTAQRRRQAAARSPAGGSGRPCGRRTSTATAASRSTRGSRAAA